MPHFLDHVIYPAFATGIARRPCALHFIILQLLRKASKRIIEAVEGLKSLKEDFNISTTQLPQKLTLVSRQDGNWKATSRVHKKTNKAECLRDGVCPE